MHSFLFFSPEIFAWRDGQFFGVMTCWMRHLLVISWYHVFISGQKAGTFCPHFAHPWNASMVWTRSYTNASTNYGPMFYGPLCSKTLTSKIHSHNHKWWCLPSRKRSHIPPFEKENHRLKIAVSGDMLVPRRVGFWCHGGVSERTERSIATHRILEIVVASC